MHICIISIVGFVVFLPSGFISGGHTPIGVLIWRDLQNGEEKCFLEFREGCKKIKGSFYGLKRGKKEAQKGFTLVNFAEALVSSEGLLKGPFISFQPSLRFLLCVQMKWPVRKIPPLAMGKFTTDEKNYFHICFCKKILIVRKTFDIFWNVFFKEEIPWNLLSKYLRRIFTVPNLTFYWIGS